MVHKIANSIKLMDGSYYEVGQFGCEKIALDNGEFWSIYVNGTKKTWIDKESIAYIDGQSQQPESYLADMSDEDRAKFKDIHCDCD
ncbi:hypothetical protein N2E09_09495 [Leuconostoc citreum]|uniref:hypothetical protein n=1 Tax=Leuconostoc citreum TaxID=33964 RepID=UPI00200AB9EE|nr:hypothetical protein [Leuconostoc citreum]MCK8606204.1 hypothetical protein [Leuconostoc citreum]